MHCSPRNALKAVNKSQPLSLTDSHLADLLRLSTQAGWNQTTDDWRFMLQAGHGWGIATDSNPAQLIASTIVLPYPPRISWISMVLVDPEYRRQGLATALLEVALNDLQKHGLTAVLDATADGQTVYQQLGFAASISYTRYLRQPGKLKVPQITGPADQNIHVREFCADDWPDVLMMDKKSFRASRDLLLRHLVERSPNTAYIAEANGKFAGFVLGRDGCRAHQIGPLVSVNGQNASRLLCKVLSKINKPVLVDLLDEHVDLQQFLIQAGFVSQRSFSRMSLNAVNAKYTGDPRSKQNQTCEQEPLAYLVAGPELG